MFNTLYRADVTTPLIHLLKNAVHACLSLQWDLRKTPKSWGGLLVKVQFKCKDITSSKNDEMEHCVVIKYAETFKGNFFLQNCQ